MYSMLFMVPLFWPVPLANVHYDFRFYTDLSFVTSIWKNKLQQYTVIYHPQWYHLLKKTHLRKYGRF